MRKNYYEILEVDKRASEEVLEKAYKALVVKYHPDLQNGITKAEYEQKMQLINEAYDVLSNKELRKQYDEELINYEEEDKRRMQEKSTNTVINQMYNNIRKQQQSIYKQKKPLTQKQKKIIVYILIVIFIISLIAQIPFVHRLYQKNAISKALIDPFANTFKFIFHI